MFALEDSGDFDFEGIILPTQKEEYIIKAKVYSVTDPSEYLQ